MSNLAKMTTLWTEMELEGQEGVRNLADFLACRYYQVLVKEFKKKMYQINDIDAHEMASDVIYDFIKNNYNLINKLDRNKQLRGLFFKIIKRKISKHLTTKNSKKFENIDQIQLEDNLNYYMDLNVEIERIRDKLNKEKPQLYKIFLLYHFENKTINEISQECDIKENAVKQRLRRARIWLIDNLKEELQDYNDQNIVVESNSTKNIINKLVDLWMK